MIQACSRNLIFSVSCFAILFAPQQIAHAGSVSIARSISLDKAQAVEREKTSCSSGTSALLQRVAQSCTFDTKRSLRPLPFTFDVGKPADDKPVTDPAGKPPTTRTFAYHPPGKLHPSDRRKGRVGDRYVYVPDIIFPLALPKGMYPHMNSQIYGRGGGGWGGQGKAGGSECDTRNYDPFQQRDNYCEVRGWKMPLCPSGTGHQGLDIRPPRCNDSKWDAVAVVDGTITRVTSNTTVVLKAAKDGTAYYYLHMNPKTIRVKRGSKVKQGDVLGKVSRFMKGRRLTTTHLHFQVKQNVRSGSRVISTYIPIYTSLIAALRKAKGIGPSIDKDGNLVIDSNYEIGVTAPDKVPPDKVDPPDNDKPDADKPDPVDPVPPVTDNGPPSTDDPGSETPSDAERIAELSKRAAALEQELNQLKVESQREIEKAKGASADTKAELALVQAKLVAAKNRVEEREATIRQNQELALRKETALQGKLDDAAADLQKMRAELDELKQKNRSLWQRIKSSWTSLWKR